jgi:hypothetical protein
MAQTINYQAVLRDNTDSSLVRNQKGTVVFSFWVVVENADQSQYAQYQMPEMDFETNAEGMVNLPIDFSEVEGTVDWRNNEITAVFTYGDNKTITLVTPVTAVPYAVQAKDADLTTSTIVTYINRYYDMERIWRAVKGNENLHNAMRDSIANFLKQKENYEYAKEILYSYISQVTAADLNEAYGQLQELSQETKNAIDTALKNFLKSNRNLAIEVAEYYAQTATEDEMRTIYNDLKANEPAATKIKELMDQYFAHYLAYKGLVCDTAHKTLCDAIEAMSQNGDGQDYSSNQGSLNGKFTIAANGTRVAFSQGNLQYQASTHKWRFAANQYDYVGVDNLHISDVYDGWIDQFGWGTWTGTNPNPTKADNDHSSYTWNDVDFTKESSLPSTYDWRTLSSAEWTYLLKTRSTDNTINNVSNARFTYATIYTGDTCVHGLIIFPDTCNADTPDGVEWGPINNGSTNVWPMDWRKSESDTVYTALCPSVSSTTTPTTTNCTLAGWAALEAAGCVFLPAAGYRNTGWVKKIDITHGNYWSSDNYSDTKAKYLAFGPSVNTETYRNNWKGDANVVRLVRVLNN